MDYLLSLSRNTTTRSLVKSLGLPVALPPALKRPREPRGLRLLDDREVVVGCSAVTVVTRELAKHLAPLGARVVWTGVPAEASLFSPAAEAWAEPVRTVTLDVETGREPAVVASIPEANSAGDGQVKLSEQVYGLVFDATGLRTRRDLDTFYAFFRTWASRLAPGSRVVVVASPPEAAEQIVGWERAPEAAAWWQGLEGFVRSLGKELGRKGSTANLLRVAPGAEDRLGGPLRFFLSGYSAFVTCQPLTVDSTVAPSSYSFEGPLLGKLALVTGAARGIGRATARSLFEEGAKIAMIEHPSAASEASVTARELGAKLLLCDLGTPDAPQQIRDWVAGELRGVDILVHNAGLTRDKTLTRMSRQAWDLVLDVNLDAIMRSTNELLNGNCIKKHGRIIALSSIGGIAGNVGQTNYALTKAGLIGWTRALARRLAPEGITVNAVAPGFIETQMTAQMPAMIREFARRLSALNQGGLPEDVAAAVTFFALPENYGLTGSVLRVCGGALIGA